MKNLISLVFSELKYQIASKSVYLLLIIVLLLSFFASFSQYNLLQNTEKNYLTIKEGLINDGIDINEVLKRDYSMEIDGESVNIKNNLKYYYLKYHSDLAAMKVKNSINQVLSSSLFVIFPIIISVYAIFITFLDLKNFTFNFKFVRNSNVKVILSKFLGLAIITLISLILLCSSFALFQSIFYHLYKPTGGINIQNNIIQDLSYTNKAPLQFLIIYIISIISILLYSALTLTFKNSIYPLCILLVYNLFIPNLGKYDLKENLLLMYNKLFYTASTTFIHRQVNGEFKVENFVISLILLIFISILLLIFSLRKGHLAR